MIKRIFHKGIWVELDNVAKNICILAECFLAECILNTDHKVIQKYKCDAEPLQLNNKIEEVNDVKIIYSADIVDRQNRDIAKIKLIKENKRIVYFHIEIKGIYKGQKIRQTKTLSDISLHDRLDLFYLTEALHDVLTPLEY